MRELLAAIASKSTEMKHKQILKIPSAYLFQNLWFRMVVLVADKSTSEEGGDLIAGNFMPELIKLKSLEHASGYLA